MPLKTRFLALAAFLSVPALAADPAPPTPEARLQTMLQGYTPGPGQRCLAITRMRKLTIIDGTAMVVKYAGTYFVNRPENAAVLRSDLIPMFEPDADRVCNGASVSLRTSNDFFGAGGVRLREWVPYRQSEKE